MFLTRQTDLLDGAPKRVLHIAPETFFEERIRERVGSGYLSADLVRPAMVHMDITDIQYPDATFDVILCSHVLEHVRDDRRALSELFRVTRSGGWVLLLVPIGGERTLEDDSIVDAAQRMRFFGHDDHVRLPGLDYAERMRQVGFEVTVVRSNDFLTPDEMAVMRVDSDAVLFHCRRAAGSSLRELNRS